MKGLSLLAVLIFGCALLWERSPLISSTTSISSSETVPRYLKAAFRGYREQIRRLAIGKCGSHGELAMERSCVLELLARVVHERLQKEDSYNETGWLHEEEAYNEPELAAAPYLSEQLLGLLYDLMVAATITAIATPVVLYAGSLLVNALQRVRSRATRRGN